MNTAEVEEGSYKDRYPAGPNRWESRRKSLA